MSVIIKTSEMQYKDNNGVYHGVNAVAEKKIADQVAEIDAALTAQETRISNDISTMQSAANSIESQRQTMIASIASVAGQGTDTTLTQSGVAADAATCGDLKSALRLEQKGTFAPVATDFENGSYKDSNGSKTTATTVIRTANKIPIYKGAIIKCIPGSVCASFKLGLFAEDGTYTHGSWMSSTTTYTVDVDGYVVFLLRKSNTSTDIIPSEYDADITIKTHTEKEIDDIETEITGLHTEDTTLGARIDAENADMKAEINMITRSNITKRYLYQTGAYIDLMNQVIASDVTYDLYKIPLNPLDIISVPFSAVFWGSLSETNVFVFQRTDDSFVGLSRNDGEGWCNWHQAYSQFTAMCPSDVKALYITMKHSGGIEKVPNVHINKQKIVTNESKYDFPVVLSIVDNIHSKTYIGTNGTWGRMSSSAAATYDGIFVDVNAGDVLLFEGDSGLSTRGVIKTAAGVTTEIALTSSYTVLADGVLSALIKSGYTITVVPSNATKINYAEIYNVPQNIAFDQYAGLNGVAFGTSLTERGKGTGTDWYGYLQYLPALSEITFDNQGRNSGTIVPVTGEPEIMPKITGYTGYSDKRVCLLEGFVNDWYHNANKLGTWKSTDQTTVCGAIRYAINYIWSQNPNITIFLILDHYGKGINATTAVNSNNQTQLEWWLEIEKLALSMGVNVIREYEVSQINENTQQYLLDNIHLNNLGAKQSANAIWSVMRQYFPNEIASS